MVTCKSAISKLDRMCAIRFLHCIETYSTHTYIIINSSGSTRGSLHTVRGLIWLQWAQLFAVAAGRMLLIEAVIEEA